MCAPVAWEPDQKCRYVHVPGQCCDRVVCEEEDKTNTCQEPVIANVDDKGKGRTVAVHRYPWSVLYCGDAKCRQIHGGIIVDERHILTFAPDLSYLTQLQVASDQYIVDQNNIKNFTVKHISNVTAHPHFVNENSPRADSAARLQLIKFDEPFLFSKTLQAANLPTDGAQCKALTQDSCPQMTVGWDRTDDTDDEIRQWYLHTDKSKHDETLCIPNSTSAPGQSHPRSVKPRRRGDKRSCVGGMVRDDCTGPMGGAIVAFASTVDFVVGLADPDAALLFCDHPGTALILPLCKYVDWIDQLVKE